ncbi:hypothetical protein BI364_05720 [Acidihalobacter yilgarnensis]|uniref:CRM domain-containing protein n=2 Tax=Acidihalobacter yilgarnensis TaxID=2819280 RepID=A0A1D8ISU1_9GAMM|nr:YhbY family RNA-binding protein [Acidihalobacter yilgarnensis]AOU99582.1 hypothetical protein BI364_05720 [Acidihalobacter yilgarnensis]
MVLDDQQRRALRARAHTLKPVVLIGQKGLHPSVIEEIQAALDHHELIKVRIPGGREAMGPIVDEIISATGADLVQRIGGIVALYLKKRTNQT